MLRRWINPRIPAVSRQPGNSALKSSLSVPSTLYRVRADVYIGLKVHTTPRVHPDGEVSLNMQFDISALSGEKVNGIPIFETGPIEQEVRLRANETSILSGLIRDERTSQR